MDDSDRDSLLAQFQSVSGIEDTELCYEILEQQSWDLELALQSFLGAQSPEPRDPSPPPPRRRLPREPPPRVSGVEDDDSEEVEESRRVGGVPPRRRTTRATGVSTRATGVSTRATGVSARATGVSTRATDAPQRATGASTRATGASTRATGASTRAVDLPTNPGRVSTRATEFSTRATGLPSRAPAASTRATRASTRAPAASTRSTGQPRRTPTEEPVALPDAPASRRHRNLMSFTVDVDNREETLNVIVNDTSTVLDVKRLLQQMLDEPVSLVDLQLDGLGHDDTAVLKDLGVNSGTRLRLREPQRRTTDFQVSVSRPDTGEVKQFRYRPVERLGRLKGDVSEQMGISIADQKWLTWPNGVTEATRFADSGLQHETRLDVLPRRCRRQQALIGPEVENDAEGCAQTAAALAERLGRPLPGLVSGGLADALRTAAGGGAADSRPLALLLHHENGRACPALANQAVAEYMEANYLLWCWDLTDDDKSHQLIALCHRLIGHELSTFISAIPSIRMPCLLLLHKNGSSYDLIDVVTNLRDTSSTLTQLLRGHEKFEQWRADELLAESAREHRTMERLEMESAYEESLRRDKEKEAEKKRIEQERIEQERAQQEQLKKAQHQVPLEPAEGVDAVTVRFRLPGRATHEQRRFSRKHELQHLAAYCTSLGYPDTEYNLATSFPRKILSNLPGETTLEEAGFGPQETVLVEEK